MIINLVIVLLIVIVLCGSITYSNRYKCPKNDIKIKYLRGSRLPDLQKKDQIIMDMIILKLDRDVPCGIYNLTNTYGKAILIVSSTNSRIGYMHMKNIDALVKINLFDLWDLERTESENNHLVLTFNRGCCA